MLQVERVVYVRYVIRLGTITRVQWPTYNTAIREPSVLALEYLQQSD